MMKKTINEDHRKKSFNLKELTEYQILDFQIMVLSVKIIY